MYVPRNNEGIYDIRGGTEIAAADTSPLATVLGVSLMVRVLTMKFNRLGCPGCPPAYRESDAAGVGRSRYRKHPISSHAPTDTVAMVNCRRPGLARAVVLRVRVA